MLLTFFVDTPQMIVYGVLIAALIGLLVFSMFKNKRRQAEAAQMAANLAVGDKVQTIGGIIGEIAEIDHNEGTITVKTGKSTIVFSKQAVYSFGYFERMQNNKREEAKPEETNKNESDKDNLPK